MANRSFNALQFSLEDAGLASDTSSDVEQLWHPVLQQAECEFRPEEHFEKAMINLIYYPNINSSSIMRADILYDSSSTNTANEHQEYKEREEMIYTELSNMGILKPQGSAGSVVTKRRIVRDIIPRNPDKDQPMRQTCLIYQDTNDKSEMVLYLAHGIDSPNSVPYYHPAVSGVLLTYTSSTDQEASNQFTLRLYYRLFPNSTGPISNRLERTGLRLLGTAYRHSLGVMNGYKKRVHHDVVVDRLEFQNRYLDLKRKYAHDLVTRWVESTDPRKHVFEDLSIAAFLMLLWSTRLQADGDETGKKRIKFVDIGCGNGVLVYILIMEGYIGYGLDARRRKTWDIFPKHVQDNLREQVLVPYLCADETTATDNTISIHDGIFDENTFLIGNHSDELTPWIPLLGQSGTGYITGFIIIPCCSHALSGAKHRYSTSMKTEGKTKPGEQQALSTYGALVEQVARISHDLGWVVEREMLRIPSTRNAAIIGMSQREVGPDKERIWTPQQIISREGGADGFYERVVALMAKKPRSH